MPSCSGLNENVHAASGCIIPDPITGITFYRYTLGGHELISHPSSRAQLGCECFAVIAMGWLALSSFGVTPEPLRRGHLMTAEQMWHSTLQYSLGSVEEFLSPSWRFKVFLLYIPILNQKDKLGPPW